MEDTTKVEFTAEQQDKVNKLIQDGMGRAAKEAKEQLAAIVKEKEELAAKVEELNKQVKPGEDVNKVLEAQRVVESLKEQMRAIRETATLKEQEAQQAKTQAHEMSKMYALEKSIAGRFIDPEMIISSTKDQIGWDEAFQRWVVKNPEGSPRMNASLEPMSLDEFFEEVATKKPWAVNANFRGGTGASKSGGGLVGKYTADELFGAKPNVQAAIELMRTNPAEYKRLKAQSNLSE